MCIEEELLSDRRVGAGVALAARDAEATAMFNGRGIRIFNFAFESGRGVLVTWSSSDSGVKSERTDNGELGIALLDNTGVDLSIFTDAEGCMLLIGFPWPFERVGIEQRAYGAEVVMCHE